MFLPKTSVGIEISGHELRLAVLRRAWGRVRLVALHRIPDFDTLSEEERKNTLQKLFRRVRIPAGLVFFAVPRSQGMVRQIDLPADIGEKFRNVVKLQVETLS